jgi:hypothetical protein
MLPQSIEFFHSAIGPVKFVLHQFTQFLHGRRCILAHENHFTEFEIQV